MINYSNICKTFEKFESHFDDYPGAMFINIFQTVPHAYKIYYNKEKNLTFKSTHETFDYVKDVSDCINTGLLLENAIINAEKDKNLCVFCYSSYEWLVLFDDSEHKFLVNVTTSDSDLEDYFLTLYTNDVINSFEIIKNWCVPSEKIERISFGIAAVDATNTLYTTWYDYKNHEIDIEQNYNDDIPYDRICELVETEEQAELLLFYGEPGTGKTSLIKHFISKYPNKEFVFLDGTLLANVQQDKLMAYFLENKDTVFILEDCEKVLMNREHYANPVMPILLNLTDGIIGDVLGIKLICTFNTALSNIDKALVRKGRLSLKYEFKKLVKEKVQKILKDNTINKDMTLADIYNYQEENDYSKKQQNKIGF